VEEEVAVSQKEPSFEKLPPSIIHIEGGDLIKLAGKEMWRLNRA